MADTSRKARLESFLATPFLRLKTEKRLYQHKYKSFEECVRVGFGLKNFKIMFPIKAY